MKKRVVLNTGIGCVAGIGMALLVLYLMNLAVYKLFSVTFWISCVIVCALPHCFSIVKKENLSIAPFVMILVSFLISVIYGFFVSSQYSSDMSSLFSMSFLFHALSLVSYLCGFMMQKRKMK